MEFNYLFIYYITWSFFCVIEPKNNFFYVLENPVCLIELFYHYLIFQFIYLFYNKKTQITIIVNIFLSGRIYCLESISTKQPLVGKLTR